MNNSEIFVATSPLETCIRAGDLAGTIALLRDLDRAQRASQASSLRKLAKRVKAANWDPKLSLWWGGRSSQEQTAAAQAAIFFCGNNTDRAENWAYHDQLYPFLDLLAPDELKLLASDLIQVQPVYFSVVQRLVNDGLSVRPDSDSYIIGLISLPQFNRGSRSAVLACVEADPGLLDGPLLRIFDVEGDGDSNMAAIEKYTFAEQDTWSFALLELVARGQLSRTVLLDKTLGTLERDWPQFRAGWFSRFHDRLAPTAEEMAPFAARYLGLCHSRIAPTVTLALAAAAVLLKSGVVHPAQLCEALAPVMSSGVKGQVEGALKLLDQAVSISRDLAPDASSLALRGFAHAAPDLHKKIIARLSMWGIPESAREELETMLPHVAAVHRDALAKLMGVAAPQVAAAPETDAVPAGVVAPLDPSRRLARIDDAGELLQALAYVFENGIDTDQFERALEALVRMAPALPDQRAQFSPVIKRATKVLNTDKDVARALAWLVLAVFDDVRCSANAKPTAAGELYRRVSDLSSLAALRTGLMPLSSPTHMRGFIDPAELVERIGLHQQAKVQSSVDEQVRALLRLAPGCGGEALTAARSLNQTPLVQALRYALGDDIAPGTERALFIAAARIRHPGADDVRLLDAYGCCGPDAARAARYSWQIAVRYDHPRLEYALEPALADAEPSFGAAIRHACSSSYEGFWGQREDVLWYAASMLPSSLDAYFANGLLQIGNNLDWWEAQWQNRAYLALLIDRATPVGPIGVKLLACALGGKEPGQTAMAIDAFVVVVLEQRTQPALVAQEIRAILPSGLGKCSRYAKSLASAARAHPAMPAVVCDVLGTVLDSGEGAPPKDAGALLELLLELTLANGLVLPVATRDMVARLKLSGKGKAAQKDLLIRFPVLAQA